MLSYEWPFISHNVFKTHGLLRSEWLFKLSSLSQWVIWADFFFKSSLWAFFWHWKPHQQYSCLESLPETVKCYVLSPSWDLQGKLQTGRLLGFPEAWARHPLLIHFTESTSPVKKSCLSSSLPLLLLKELSISRAWLDLREGLDLLTIVSDIIQEVSIVRMRSTGRAQYPGFFSKQHETTASCILTTFCPIFCIVLKRTNQCKNIGN